MGDVQVSQTRNLSFVHWYANIYCGVISRCPACGDKGTLSLKSSGSFQVVHYVCRFKEGGVRKTRVRFCTLISIGQLQWHCHRAFGVAIPLWSKTTNEGLL